MGCRAANFSVKSEQGSLLSPVSRQPRCSLHQRRGLELPRLPTVDDRRDDVGGQPGQPEERVDVGSRHSFLAGDVLNGQFGILTQASLDVMRASDNSQQARIGYRLVIGVLDQHSHFTTHALEACWRHQRQDIIGGAVQCLILPRQIYRLVGKQSR